MANFNNDNINERDERNHTFLHKSVFDNDLDEVKRLLQNGADASLTSNNGNTPLHCAVTRKHHQMVETLLKYSSRETVKKIIDAKTTQSGSTALHVAAINNCIESALHLLSYGANFEVKKKNGKRPRTLATDDVVKQLLVNVEVDSKFAANGSFKLLQHKLRQYSNAELRASVFARNKDGMTSLQMALINNHCNTVDMITQVRALYLHGNYGNTNENFLLASLDEFVEHGRSHSEHHSSLLPHLQDVNKMDDKTIVEIVALILLDAYNIVKVAEKVLKPVNGEPCERPIWLTIMEETLDALQFKPEHVTYNKDKEVIFRGHEARYYKMLRINDREDKGKINSFICNLQLTISRSIFMFLRAIFMLKLLVAATQNDLEPFEKYLKEKFVDPDATFVSADRRTPLHYAAENGNEQIVKMLLKKGANIHSQSAANEETALHVAAKKGHVEIIRMLVHSLPIEDWMAFVNMKTRNEGWTALHFAAKTDRLDVVKCLLESNAIYDLRDNNGKTPCDLSENMLITQFLKDIDELFEMADKGDVRLLEKLCARQNDELLAIGNARNSREYTIPTIAEVNGHRDLASHFVEIFKERVNIPLPKPESLDNDTVYRKFELYQARETLTSSIT